MSAHPYSDQSQPCRHCNAQIATGPTGGWVDADGWTTCQKGLSHEPMPEVSWKPAIGPYFDHELGAVEQAVFQEGNQWAWSCGCGANGAAPTEADADTAAEAHFKQVTGR